jgi:hypothetical protein
VPNLRDKMTEVPPAAELNPLTNPLLERNLRRWANVYFGNPPAKRERAVSNLLEELKRESGVPASESTPSSRMLDARFLGVVCSACQNPNPSGHKYCSRCGGTLKPAPPPVSETSTVQVAAEPQMSRSANPGSANLGSANDVQWVREQRFSSLSEFDTEPRRGWKYALAAVVIILAGFAYMQWNSWNTTRVASAVTTPGPQMSDPPAPSPNDSSSAESNRPQETSSQPERDSDAQKNSVPATTPDRAAVPAGVQPAAQRAPLLNAEKPQPTSPVEESGASDLRLAQHYLGSGGGPRDSSEAAKLLWKAVRKQNAAAEVLLSDLYLKGDGVPQSCDQARLLLVAAAKRGSPQAAQQLRDLESRGCR